MNKLMLTAMISPLSTGLDFSSAPTGSRIARKACMRQSEWNALARDANDATSRVQRNGNLSVPQGG